MKRLLELIAIFLIGYLIGAIIIMSMAKAETVKIAVIDTGYNADLLAGTKLKLCPTGHYDFVTNTPTIGYSDPHGTEVAGVLAEELKYADYCALVYNVYIKHGMPDTATIEAYKKAAKAGAKVFNLSFVAHNISVAERETLKVIAKDAIVFAAAGNDRMNLDEECLSFPTCFDIPGVYSVGALDDTGHRAKYSDYGKRVKLWYSGKGLWDNGTSFATPRAVAAFVKRLIILTH